MTGQLSENQRRYHPLAIMALGMGLVPLLYASTGLPGLAFLRFEVSIPVLVLAAGAVAVGVVGQKQIKTTGQRGRGLAIAGCVAGAAAFAIMVLALLLMILTMKDWSSGGCGPPDPCW